MNSGHHLAQLNIAGLVAPMILLMVPPAFAGDVQVPDYAYDMLTQIGLANTADLQCDGLRLRAKKMNAAMTDLVMKLAADGHDPTAVVQEMSTVAGLAEVAARQAALRQKHGVAADGYQALCIVIRAEMAENAALSAMLRGE